MEEKKEWIKYQCVYCGYEQASQSKKPRCTHCGSRRLNIIKEFTTSKPFKKEKVPEAQEDEMNKPNKIEEKPREEETTAVEEDDDDLDLFGDD